MKKLNFILTLIIAGFLFNGCDKDEEVAAVLGCVDSTACNYDANATEDDGSCEFVSFPSDCDGCLNAMAVENNEYYFSSATMADNGCADDYDYYYNEYNGNYYYWNEYCAVTIVLMGDGISLEEVTDEYYDYYTGEYVEYSYWEYVGQGDLMMWQVYFDANDGSLAGTYELASGGSDGYYYYGEDGTYMNESGYAFNFDPLNADGPTAVFTDGALIITETSNGLYNIAFNHEGDDGNSVMGCYDGLELVNYMESRMQEGTSNNWAKSFLTPKKSEK